MIIVNFEPACLRRGRQACLPNLMACRSRQVLNFELVFYLATFVNVILIRGNLR